MIGDDKSDLAQIMKSVGFELLRSTGIPKPVACSKFSQKFSLYASPARRASHTAVAAGYNSINRRSPAKRDCALHTAGTTATSRVISSASASDKGAKPITGGHFSDAKNSRQLLSVLSQFSMVARDHIMAFSRCSAEKRIC